MRKVDDKLRFECGYIEQKDGCWEWRGDMRFYYNGIYDKAYRVSYMLYNGEIPIGKSIHRKCNNVKCVNPEHLDLVDHEGAGKKRLSICNDMYTILSKIQDKFNCSEEEACLWLSKGIISGGIKDNKLFDIVDMGKGLS